MDENRSLLACFSLPLSRPINNEQALNSSHIGKQIPIKRRKYMKMPLTEKQVKNLADQRTFRKCNYIRTLETKTSQLEMLYDSAQKEIKSLRERIVILEKRLESSGIDEYYGDVNMNDDNIDNSLTSSAKKHNLI